jgi:hypothetical protein
MQSSIDLLEDLADVKQYCLINVGINFHNRHFNLSTYII